jgi:uncharacterized protein YodC (DUF2158 family)
MKLTTKYSIHDKVYIKELKLWGRITGIYFNIAGHEYNCRYFISSKPETCYFQEDEIQLEEPEKLGFKNGTKE